jgi:hypothetical protein
MERAAARPLEEMEAAELEALWAGAKRKLAAEARLGDQEPGREGRG